MRTPFWITALAFVLAVGSLLARDDQPNKASGEADLVDKVVLPTGLPYDAYPPYSLLVFRLNRQPPFVVSPGVELDLEKDRVRFEILWRELPVQGPSSSSGEQAGPVVEFDRQKMTLMTYVPGGLRAGRYEVRVRIYFSTAGKSFGPFGSKAKEVTVAPRYRIAVEPAHAHPGAPVTITLIPGPYSEALENTRVFFDGDEASVVDRVPAGLKVHVPRGLAPGHRPQITARIRFDGPQIFSEPFTEFALDAVSVPQPFDTPLDRLKSTPMDRFWQIVVGLVGIGGVGAFVFWSLYRGWLKPRQQAMPDLRMRVEKSD